MNANDYYKHQAKARGLFDADATLALCRSLHKIYNYILPKWLPADNNAVIYEAACGPGIILSWLKNNGYHNISGSDSSPEQIELAHALELPAHIGESIAEIESFSPDSHDIIIAIDFYEHLPKDDFVRFLTAAGRALKPGGALILRGPNGDSPVVGLNLFNDITHHWAYTTVALRANLQMCGFSSVDFADGAIVGIEQNRCIKLPLTLTAQFLLRTLLRSATKENIRYLGASIYLRAQK